MYSLLSEALCWWLYMHHLTELSQQHLGSITVLIDSSISSNTSQCTWCPDVLNVLVFGTHRLFPSPIYMPLSLLLLDLGMTTDLWRCSSNSTLLLGLPRQNCLQIPFPLITYKTYESLWLHYIIIMFICLYLSVGLTERMWTIIYSSL